MALSSIIIFKIRAQKLLCFTFFWFQLGYNSKIEFSIKLFISVFKNIDFTIFLNLVWKIFNLDKIQTCVF